MVVTLMLTLDTGTKCNHKEVNMAYLTDIKLYKTTLTQAEIVHPTKLPAQGADGENTEGRSPVVWPQPRSARGWSRRRCLPGHCVNVWLRLAAPTEPLPPTGFVRAALSKGQKQG